jgi:glyoxalase family protein
MEISGLHHVTAMASNPAMNVDFYTRILGLRLVKKTVNFDDPGTYHLYYGDETGSPGTILTFFPWEGARPGTVGGGQVTEYSFRIPPGSVAFWQEHLQRSNVESGGPSKRFGEALLTLRDPDGFAISLIETPAPSQIRPWTGSSVPQEFAIRGFHGATLTLQNISRTTRLLESVMGCERGPVEENRTRVYIGTGETRGAVDLLEIPTVRNGTMGTGIVHHIAWRTPTDEAQIEARRQLIGAGLGVSPVMDRKYFHSIYYREPGGVLFEIATDPPGFDVDEPRDELGKKLMLPPWLESSRNIIEKALPSLEPNPPTQ